MYYPENTMSNSLFPLSNSRGGSWSNSQPWSQPHMNPNAPGLQGVRNTKQGSRYSPVSGDYNGMDFASNVVPNQGRRSPRDLVAASRARAAEAARRPSPRELVAASRARAAVGRVTPVTTHPTSGMGGPIGVNMNLSSSMSSIYDIPGVKGSSGSPIGEALHSGRMMGGPMKGRGLPLGIGGMAGAIGGAGIAGYYAGDQTAGSFATGMAGGVFSGAVALNAASAAHSAFSSYSGAAATARRAASTSSTEAMSAGAAKAMSAGRMMTSAHNRGMLFAGGALLGGSFFSSMFSSNSNSYKRGLNAGRGNNIVR